MINHKILIAGIGGVGGFFGGMLAHHYEGNENVKIHFLARGTHLNKIKSAGLKIINGKEVFVAHPASASSLPTDIGPVDYIMVCSKTYGLAEMLELIKPCIHKKTVILPLLNGIENAEKVKTFYPNNLVLDGCVYLVSRLKEPGVILNGGNIQKLFFGVENLIDPRLSELEEILLSANIEATNSISIKSILWEKYIFVSSIATATSLYDKNIGEILGDPNFYKTLESLIAEVILLAKSRGISIANDFSEKTIAKLRTLSSEATSSLHSDIRNQNTHNELSSLTGFVVAESTKYGIATPTYTLALKELSKRTF